jgi:hypothetical protein
VRKWKTVSGASLHARHSEDMNFFMQNRYFWSGACPNLSWNSMAACCLGSPAMSPAKLSEERGRSMCLIFLYLGELFHMFNAMFLNVAPCNCLSFNALRESWFCRMGEREISWQLSLLRRLLLCCPGYLSGLGSSV